MRITLHAQYVFRLPGVEHKRPGSGFVRRQPAVAPVVIYLVGLHRFAVEHAQIAQRAERVNHQLWVIGFRQHDLDRIVVRRADLLVDIFLAETIGFPHRRLRQIQMQQTTHRPHHVLCGERVAGVKFNVITQMEGQGFAIRSDIPAFR
ncbi:hypothetical protein D3C78_1470040 [compost metagenome]